jgi:signal transduction histidine kinase/DNA-binding response OmpR family regulator/streptogramin lyase
MRRQQTTVWIRWALPWAMFWGFLLPLTQRGMAQTVTSIIRQFEVPDGLSTREVYSILEDSNGFIWLGSEKGLQRFDGQEFATWTPYRDHPLLKDIYVLGMDAEGWLWMFSNTDRKFLFFHPTTEQFQTAPERFGASFPLFKNDKNKGWFDLKGHVPVDSKGRMVFPMNDPWQIVFYQSGQGFSTSPLSHEIPQGAALMAIDRKDCLWFISYGEKSSLFRTNAEGKLLSQHDLAGNVESPFACATPDHVLIMTKGPEGKQFTTLDLATGEVQIGPPIEDALRLQSNGFLLRLLTDRWEVSSLKNPGKRLHTVALDKYKYSLHKGVKHAYQDSKGRLWMLGEWGLTCWDIRPGKFDRLMWFDGAQEKPFHNTVRGIYADDSTLYANFESVGLVRMSLHDPDDWEVMDPALRPSDLPSTFLSSRPLIRLRDGTLELAQTAEIININPKTQQHKSIHLDEKVFWQLWALHEDAQGRLWVGGEGVLGLVKPDGSVETIELWPGNKIWKVVYQFLPDGQGHFWLSTHSGLLLFDPQQKKVLASYGKEQEGNFHLPTSVIHHHHIDSDSIHWLATDIGLIEWNPRTHETHTYTTLDGLSSDVVYGIFEDRSGLLWLSSDYGIMRFNKENHSVRTYLENEGITHTEFNRISAFQAQNGTIYFGGLNGVTAIRPDDFTEDKSDKPVIQVTGFEMFDRVQNKVISPVGELRKNKSITFGPEVGYVRINFAIPNPLDDKLVLYAWRLKETGENWSYQKTNSIQLATLAYGTYTLQIMGKDHTGNWSEPIEITLRVPRPFYLQGWFFILCGLLLVALVFVFFRRRTALLRKRQQQLETEISLATARIMEDKQTIARQMEELQQLDKTRSRFFANVAHEFRTPLTLIYGPISSVIQSGEVSPAQLRLLQTARENTDSLVKMIGQLLDLTKLESGKMELQETALELKPWLERFAAGFESLLAQKGISFELQYTGDPAFAFAVDRDKLNTLLKNLFSNAVKFTPSGGNIQLSAQVGQEAVVIAVRDTGRGIHPDDLPYVFDLYYQSRQPGAPVEGGTGIGLAICREFARLMGGQVTAESTLGKGSVFRLQLPAKPALPSHPEDEIVATTPDADQEEILLPPLSDGDAKPTLLLVEDNPSLQDYLRTILSPSCNLVQAANGKLALEQLELAGNALPDLVISDVMMPEMDGFQLLEALKAHPRYGHLPIIMLTARAGLEDKLKALRMGVDDYLTKPFEEAELLTRVANLLRNAALRRQAQQEETPIAETPQVMGQADREWLTRLEEYVSAHLQESTLSVARLCSEFAMSESTFRRQVKRLVGLTPQEYLNEHKLMRAMHLLETGAANSVAQLAEEVGYEDAKAFTRSFKNRFGKPPSEFLR